MSFNDYNSLRKKIQFYTFVQMRPGKVGMLINIPSSLLLLKGGLREARWLGLSHIKRKQRALFPYKSKKNLYLSAPAFASSRQNIVRKISVYYFGRRFTYRR